MTRGGSIQLFATGSFIYHGLPRRIAVSYYDSITTDDANPVKRLVQRRRLAHGLRVLKSLRSDFDGTILDVGAGTGRLCEQLTLRFPRARIVCYEPVPSLCAEAAEKLAACPGVEVVGLLDSTSVSRFDFVFCLEVLEHLPRLETTTLLDAIDQRVAHHSTVTFGVPNEIFAAAFAKGLFRLRRRRGSFDARWSHIWQAMVGRPPRQRPTAEIWPGLRYHYHHLGFDYRLLRRTLARRFDVTEVYGSPLTLLPTALNSEVYFICRPRRTAPVPSPHCSVSQTQAST